MNSESVLGGVVSGLVVLGIARVWRMYRKKAMRDDLIFYQMERDHLERMKKSSVEMSRGGFLAIFAIFFLISVANIMQLLPLVSGSYGAQFVAGIAVLIVWGLALGTSGLYLKRFHSLRAYAESLRKLDAKIETLREKLGLKD